MANKNIYEILEKVCSDNEPGKPTLAEKLKKEIELNPALHELLRMNFAPNFIGLELPEGMPPHKEHVKQPYGYGEVSLMMETKRLYLFVNGFVKLTKQQKETRFIELIEALHWREAELLVAIKDRKLTDLFPLINNLLISEVAPDILPPLTFEDGIVAAVYRKSTKHGINEIVSSNYNWKVYTPQELLEQSLHGNIVFKYPEQATEENGLNVLLPDFVPPDGKKVVIETTKTKQGRPKKGENRVPKKYVKVAVDKRTLRKKVKEEVPEKTEIPQDSVDK